MNPKVSSYIDDSHFRSALILLRTLLLDCGLVESYKWKLPCFTYNSINLILLSATNYKCTVHILNGWLSPNAPGLLLPPRKNSQRSRVMKFSTDQEVLISSEIIRYYVLESIEIARVGVNAKINSISEIVPTELKQVFSLDYLFEKAFYKLSLDQQKVYLNYFSGAKRAKTRLSRIELYKSRIVNGFGFNDCICGFSKISPRCDGSHKLLNR